MLHRLNSAATLIQRTTTEAPRGHIYYIGLDVHKKKISYCVKEVSGRIQQEGKVGSTRHELDCWMKTLPQPWTVAMEATIFSGWIYDHLFPHAMSRASARSSRPSVTAASCGDERNSADKAMRMPLSKQRNKHIQRTLVEAAKLAPRQSHELSLIYDREKQKGNGNRATLAVARKIVAYLLAVAAEGLRAC